MPFENIGKELEQLCIGRSNLKYLEVKIVDANLNYLVLSFDKKSVGGLYRGSCSVLCGHSKSKKKESAT